MKPQQWLPLFVFLAVSIPVVLLLGALDVAGDYRVWIALAAGALASAAVQARIKSRGKQE